VFDTLGARRSPPLRRPPPVVAPVKSASDDDDDFLLQLLVQSPGGQTSQATGCQTLLPEQMKILGRSGIPSAACGGLEALTQSFGLRMPSSGRFQTLLPEQLDQATQDAIAMQKLLGGTDLPSPVPPGETLTLEGPPQFVVHVQRDADAIRALMTRALLGSTLRGTEDDDAIRKLSGTGDGDAIRKLLGVGQSWPAQGTKLMQDVQSLHDLMSQPASPVAAAASPEITQLQDTLAIKRLMEGL